MDNFSHHDQGPVNDDTLGKSNTDYEVLSNEGTMKVTSFDSDSDSETQS
jgi:hypothetical protein